jgi:hypothetical protein
MGSCRLARLEEAWVLRYDETAPSGEAFMERWIKIKNHIFGKSRFWQGFPGENRLKSHRAPRIRRKR